MLDIHERLNKLQWERDLAKRGSDGRNMSPELAEALRNEIRTALDANGGHFDVNVARRVYDLAIAARDMCVAASSSVKEALDTIKDVGGPMESLDRPDTPESQMQISETFGARLQRELLAVVPTLTRPREGEDPKAIVHALAEARSCGMHDVAEELEVKLFGRVLSGPRPVAVEQPVSIEIPEGSFDHGLADGRVGAPVAHESVDYREGYKAGTTARFLNGVTRLDGAPKCVCPAFDDARNGMHHDQACPRFAWAALDEEEIARLHPDARDRYARNALSILASASGAADGATP